VKVVEDIIHTDIIVRRNRMFETNFQISPVGGFVRGSQFISVTAELTGNRVPHDASERIVTNCV